MKHESPKAFLNAMPLLVAKTAGELKLPPDILGEATQPYDITINEQVIFLDPQKRKYGPYRARGVQIDEVRGRVHLLQNTSSESMISLSDYQLAELEKSGRFFPKEASAEWDTSDVALTDKERAVAQRNLDYATAVLEAARDADLKITKKLIEDAVSRHAAARGDVKPLCYNTVRKYLEIHMSAPFNPLAAMAPGTSSGNRIRKYSDRFEALTKLCAYKTWEQPKGSWRTLKRILLKQLELPENMDIANEVLDGDGHLIPADITLQRRLYAVDRYTRALLRYGEKAAKKMFFNSTRRILPNAVLDEVEVDYATVDVNVYSDDMPISFGRPKIILFRDRHSGVVLGFCIFFGNPSLEFFLHGLRHAIYPKDMSKYPGFKYPFYGKPVVLIFDNDTTLLTDDVKHACDVLGIVARQCRPGEPNDKGGIERLIRTLNDYLLHNIPGSTQSNPTRRKAFDKEKEAGVPNLTLSGLEAFITKFICGEYHVHPHGGLGLTRFMKGTPSERWKKSIVDVKMRPPLNPQTFLSLVGTRQKVTIQNGMVRIGYITYTHPALTILETRPAHRAAEPGVATTEYWTVQDPSGIHRVSLIDHLDGNRVIELDVAEGDRKYATGKRLFQHQAVIRAYNRWLKKEPVDTADFQRFFDAHMSELDAMHQKLASQKTAELLANFTSDLGKKRRLTKVVEVAYSESASAARIDYEEPFAPEPNASIDAAPTEPPATPREIIEFDAAGNPFHGDTLAGEVAKQRRKPKSAIKPSIEDMDDNIAALMAKYEGYDQ